MNGKKSNGMSLVELLIYMSILSILTGTLAGVLYFGKSAWVGSVANTSCLQDFQVISRKIYEELGQSEFSSITDNTLDSIHAFSFLSAVNSTGMTVVDNNGYMTWQKYIIYYIPAGTTNLLHKEVYGNFTEPLSSSDLRNYCDGSGNLMSTAVSSLTLTQNSDSNSVQFTLTVSSVDQAGKTQQISGDLIVHVAF
jgi:hypothetical protein